MLSSSPALTRKTGEAAPWALGFPVWEAICLLHLVKCLLPVETKVMSMFSHTLLRGQERAVSRAANPATPVTSGFSRVRRGPGPRGR